MAIKAETASLVAAVASAVAGIGSAIAAFQAVQLASQERDTPYKTALYAARWEAIQEYARASANLSTALNLAAIAVPVEAERPQTLKTNERCAASSGSSGGPTGNKSMGRVYRRLEFSESTLESRNRANAESSGRCRERSLRVLSTFRSLR